MVAVMLGKKYLCFEDIADVSPSTFTSFKSSTFIKKLYYGFKNRTVNKNLRGILYNVSLSQGVGAKLKISCYLYLCERFL